MLSPWQIDRLKRMLGVLAVVFAPVIAYVGGHLANNISLLRLMTILFSAMGLAYLGLRCAMG